MSKRRSRRRPAARRSVGSRLDTVGKKVVAIAAAVVAITSAVAGIRALVPKSVSPVDVRASLESVDLRVGVALDEFAAQETFITASLPPGEAARGLATAVPALGVRRFLLAATSTDGDAPATEQPSGEAKDEGSTPPDSGTPDAVEPKPDDGTTDGGTDSSGDGEGTSDDRETPTTPDEESTSTTGQDDDSGQAEDGLPALAGLEKGCRGRDCGAFLNEADERKSVPELRRETQQIDQTVDRRFDVGDTCSDPTSAECPLAVGVRATAGATETLTAADTPKGRALKQLALARAVLRQLRNTKSAPGPDGKRRPLGVVVTYRLTLCGFKDHGAGVFWSMLDTDRPPHLPYRWMYHRRAQVIRQRSTNCEDVSPSFWVPLPAAKGRFRLELSVLDEDGETRFTRRTPSFPA